MNLKDFKLDVAQISYITFILGADSFEISEMLRERANDWGMDGLYDNCECIAHAFAIYDWCTDNQEYMSEYESLVEFLSRYDDAIKTCINNDYLDIVEIVRRDFNEQN